MYRNGALVEIKTQTDWNLIGCSMTAPPVLSYVIAQQYSFATYVSLRFSLFHIFPFFKKKTAQL
jgi:hypothetical protein